MYSVTCYVVYYNDCITYSDIHGVNAITLQLPALFNVLIHLIFLMPTLLQYYRLINMITSLNSVKLL